MNERNEADDKSAEDYMRRLAHHASGNFMRLSWPKNIISVMCAEILSLRADVKAIKAKQHAKHE